MADTEENKNEKFDLKAFSEDFNTKMKGLTEAVDVIKTKTQEIDTEVRTIKTKPAPKKEEEEDDFGDDEFFGDPKKLEKKIEERVDKKVAEKLSARDAQANYAEKCTEWDTKADSEFPMTNKKFQEEVREEMEKNINPLRDMNGNVIKDGNGRALYPPDAVYNAANRIYVRWDKAGKFDEENEITPEDLDTGEYRKKIKGRDLEGIRVELGSKLGLKPAQIKKAYDRYQERTGKAFKGSRKRD